MSTARAARPVLHGRSTNKTPSRAKDKSDKVAVASSNISTKHSRNDPDLLAKRLETSLKIQDASVLSAQKATKAPLPSTLRRTTAPTSPKSSSESSRALMQAVNAALATLSAQNKAGVRMSARPDPSKVSDARSAASKASTALAKLRSLARDARVAKTLLDIERAATSIVGHLVEMEMYKEALSELKAMRDSVMVWCNLPNAAHTTAIDGSMSHIGLLHFEQPAAGPSNIVPDHELALLVIIIQQFILLCVLRMPTTSTEAAKRPVAMRKVINSPLVWRDRLQASSDADEASRKRADAAMTSMFGATIKNTADWDPATVRPEDAFAIRTRGLLMFATTSAVLDSAKLSSFLDQVRKTFLLFGRQCEACKMGPAQIHTAVKSAFDELLLRIPLSSVQATSSWPALMELFIYLARRAGDGLFIQQLANDSEQPDTTVCSPEDRKALVQRLTSILANFEANDSFSDLEVEYLLRATVVVKTAANIEDESERRIDLLLGRIQSAACRLLRGRKRLDELVQKDSGGTDRDPALAAMLALVRCSIDTKVDRPSDSEGLVQYIETLVLLAFASLSIFDAPSQQTAFSDLERSLALLRLNEPADKNATLLRHPQAARSVASAFYNIGGLLFNSGRQADASRFLERSCVLGKRFLLAYTDLDTGPTSSSEQASVASELLKHAVKRWELLGLSYHTTGNKKQAAEAYSEALQSLQRETVSEIANAMGSRSVADIMQDQQPVVKLIHRVTKLRTFDLMLSPSLKSDLDQAGWPSAAIGFALEVQLQLLSDFAPSQEGDAAVRAVTEDLLDIYDSKRCPLRRARVLSTGFSQCTGPDQSLAEVKALCSTGTFGDDQNLATYRFEYLARAHLNLALSDSRQNAEGLKYSYAICDHVSEAIKLLEQSWLSVPTDSTASLRRSTTSTRPVMLPKVAAAATSLPTPATSRRKPTKPAAPPKTPNRKPLATRKLSDADAPAINESPKRRASLGKLEGRCQQDMRSTLLILESVLSRLQALNLTLETINVLRFLRKCSVHVEKADNAFTKYSALLAEASLRIGHRAQAGLALAQGEARIEESAARGAKVDTEIRLLLKTTSAHYYATIGNHDKSNSAWAETIDLQSAIENSGKTILARGAELSRVASAAYTRAQIERQQGDFEISLSLAMQTKPGRQASAAFDGSGKLTNGSLEPAPMISSNSTTPRLHGAAASLGWSLAALQVDALLLVANLHHQRGNPKSAEHFATQAIEFAESASLPAQTLRGLAIRTDVRLHCARPREAFEDLQTMEKILIGSAESACLLERVAYERLRAVYSLIDENIVQARQACERASAYMDRFVDVAGDSAAHHTNLTALIASPTRMSRHSLASPAPLLHAQRPSHAASTHDQIVLPDQVALLITILSVKSREHKLADVKKVLMALSNLAVSDELQAEEQRVASSRQLQKALVRHANDPLLGLLPESVLTGPTIGSASLKVGSAMAASDALAGEMQEVEVQVRSALALALPRSMPHKVRELGFMAVMSRLLQTNLGRVSKRGAMAIAHALDSSCALTLKREMLTAIAAKNGNARSASDDLAWPKAVSKVEMDTSSEADDAAYWLAVKDRYASDSEHQSLTDVGIEQLLPDEWCIVSLQMSKDRSTIVISRQDAKQQPLVVKLPLDRMARREGEEESFTFEMARAELKDIIDRCNDSAQRAKGVSDRDDRVAWWQERKELDLRLKTLLETMENDWLGCFKTLLTRQRRASTESFLAFKTTVELLLKRSIVRAQSKKTIRFKFNEELLHCLAGLPSTTRDEDLEDLVYFLTESFQIGGVPIASDEIDVDQAIVDLRTALEELDAASEPFGQDLEQQEHVVFVLDGDLQPFPIESLPSVRGRSASRVPSVSFLRDRLELAAVQQQAPGCGEFLADSDNMAYVLNPGGDLRNTQSTFEPWLKSVKQWTGVVGRAPMEEEVRSSLINKDVFLYFGHGGAEQYVRSQTIRHLKRCAVTMLWGCSSGHLKELGLYEPNGTPNHYMIGGCPTLVANLWDVTDKDIDKLADAVFCKTGLKKGDDLGDNMTVTRAVATSRDVCNLRYLNGAACVVYGIPSVFVSKTGGRKVS